MSEWCGKSDWGGRGRYGTGKRKESEWLFGRRMKWPDEEHSEG